MIGVQPWQPSDCVGDLDGTLVVFDDPDTGAVVTAVDFGWPQVRDVSTDRPAESGTVDDTALHGARAVTVDVVLPGDDEVGFWRDTLAAVAHPSRRWWLVWDEPVATWQSGAATRRMMMVRPAGMPMARTGSRTLTGQLAFVAPDGVAVSYDLRSVVAPPIAAAADGRVYDLVFDRVYPPASPSTPATVVHPGSAPARWVARVYGPCTDPSVKFTIADPFTGVSSQVVAFATSGLTVPAGDFVDFAAGDHTVTVNGDPTISRYGFLDFAATTWQPIPAGSTCGVTFDAATSAPPAQCVLMWRDTWI